MKILGRHLLVDFYECDNRVISDVRRIEEIMVGAAKKARAHIVDVVFHNFNPNGVSGVVVIAESHLTIHTWPEHRFASVDIYTCGKSIDPWKAYDFMAKLLKAKKYTANELKRGMLPPGRKRRSA